MELYNIVASNIIAGKQCINCVWSKKATPGFIYCLNDKDYKDFIGLDGISIKDYARGILWKEMYSCEYWNSSEESPPGA